MGVPCVALTLYLTESMQVDEERAIMAMQEARIKMTLKLLEQSKDLNK